MTSIRVLGFDGLIPKLSPSLLGENFAQVASNVKLYSKELRFWRGPLLAYAPPPAAYKTLYRLFNSVGGSVFLLWLTEVDVAVSPVADTTESRIYYTGDGTPKKTNYAMATSGAEPYPSASTGFMEMGVPAPLTAPTLALTPDGTGTVETRAYVYTYISHFGAVSAESAPSPAASIDVKPTGATVTVSGFAAPPAGYNITSRRIYRTVVGASTVTYQFVEEVILATASYPDSKTVAQLGEVLGTIGWLPPPATLAGLVSLPGGALAGFVGNTVYFSEPYHPHAWPLKYAITLPVNKIVGLGVVGSSVAVMSDTQPFFIHGGDPGSMYTEKVPLQEPCVAKATIAADEDGVVYASPNGLVLLSAQTRGLVTNTLFTYDEWRPLVPATMKSVVMEGRYFGVFPNETPSRCLILSRGDPPALSYMNMPALCMHVDARNGFLFYVNDHDNFVYQLDADDETPMNYEWRSKRWFVDQAQTFSLLRLDADFGQVLSAEAFQAAYDAAVAWNTAHFPGPLMGAMNEVPINTWDVNGSILLNLPRRASSRTVQVVIYGDDHNVVANLTPYTLDPIRVPPFKCRQLELAILGNINVRSLHLATTIEELKSS
jgi:hypothetical protein